jgi:hypothetical protein
MMLLAMLALQAAVEPGSLRTFQDWIVGCDNGRACHAVALATFDGDNDGTLTMSLRRGAAGDAEPVLSIEARADLCGASLAADGRRLRARIIEGPTCTIVHPADVPELIAALRGAQWLQAVGAEGAPAGTISLRGAAAAMLYIDEAQGRLDTETALVRRGPRSADTVPQPRALPVVRAAPIYMGSSIALDDDRVAAIRRRTGCTIDEVGGPDEFSLYPLEPGKTLMLLACGTGAYNLSSIPLIVQERSGRIVADAAAFDSVAGFDDEDAPPALVNAEWDGSNGILSEFPRGRGLGDCGSRSHYAWDGARFRLVLREEMGECRGAYDFIRTWRARVERTEAR